MKVIIFFLLFGFIGLAQDVLVIHREQQSSSPTYTMEATRYFAAVTGAGGTLADSQKVNINEFCECIHDSLGVDSLS